MDQAIKNGQALLKQTTGNAIPPPALVSPPISLSTETGRSRLKLIRGQCYKDPVGPQMNGVDTDGLTRGLTIDSIYKGLTQYWHLFSWP